MVETVVTEELEGSVATVAWAVVARAPAGVRSMAVLVGTAVKGATAAAAAAVPVATAMRSMSRTGARVRAGFRPPIPWTIAMQDEEARVEPEGTLVPMAVMAQLERHTSKTGSVLPP